MLSGHGVGQGVIGITGMAVQASLFVATFEDLVHDRAVVMLAALLTTGGPRAPGFFAQIAPLREGKEGHHQRARQGDHVPARAAAFCCGLLRSGTHKCRQALQIGHAIEHQHMLGFVVQHVLRKTCGERSKLLHERRITQLRRTCQARARANKVEVHAVEQPRLFWRQRQRMAPLVQAIDAGKECRIHIHRVGMRSQRRGKLALCCLQGGVGL